MNLGSCSCGSPLDLRQNRRKFLSMAGLGSLALLTGRFSFADARGLVNNVSPVAGGELLMQQNERMAWWREARFGMFVHLGAYSVYGGEYQGRRTRSMAEWIEHSERIPYNEYEQAATKFHPTKFSAERLAGLAKRAGMKYLVIGTKHHEGFCMWDTQLTDYNIVKWGRFGRDPLKEVAAECQRQGIKLGFYYSVRDWHHPDWMRYAYLGNPGPNYRGWWGYPASPWTGNRIYDCGCESCVADRPIPPNVDPRPTSDVDMNRYLDYMKGQITELLTGYGPVGVMWFDGQDIEDAKLGRVEEMVATMRKLQPGIIINDRIGPDGTEFGDYGVHEGSIPGTNVPRDWETCVTSNSSWGFNKFDLNWVDSSTMIHWLADTTSKGGNLLLNVGPDGLGQVPEPAANNLAQVGAWLDVNGASIYGCGSAGLPQPKWGRITAKDNMLYLHVFDSPSDAHLIVPKLSKSVDKAYFLVDTNKTPLPVTITDEGLQIATPNFQPSHADTVIAIELRA